MRKNVSLGRRIYRICIIIIFLYCSIGIALYYLQDKFLLHPVELLPSYEYSFDIPFREVNIQIDKNTSLSMVQFPVADREAKGVVLYFHGNKGNINTYAKYAKEFTGRGYEVWMPDYPGFGKSTGEFNEDLVYEEAREVYKLARSKFGTDSIILYGRSLGSGPASYIASKLPAGLLILESPFYSVPSVFAHYAPIYPVGRMANYKFKTGEHVSETRIPVVIFHGKKDGMIPYKNAAKIKKHLKTIDEFITVEAGEHNNLSSFAAYQNKMNELLGH